MDTESLLNEYEARERKGLYPQVFLPPSVKEALRQVPEERVTFRIGPISIGAVASFFLLLFIIRHPSGWLILPIIIIFIIFDATIAYKSRKEKIEQENKRIRQIINDPKLLRERRENRAKEELKGIEVNMFESESKEGLCDKILFDAVKAIPNSRPKMGKAVFFGYAPDVILHIPSIGVWIDLEVDEPWCNDKFNEKQPRHYVEDAWDYIRNTRFLDEEWIVIRFAELQVALHPKSCAKEVAKILTLFGFDVLDKFSDIKDLAQVYKL